MRKFSKLVKPKATRLTRFKWLFHAFGGALETLAWCQATMGSNQFSEVRATRLTSKGAERFEASSMMSRN